MFKHIVMWKLKEFAEGRSKAENARLLKSKLEALKFEVPVILSIEAGVNVISSDSNFDLVLSLEFEKREDLVVYMAHPAHVEVSELVSRLRAERVAVDYACE